MSGETDRELIHELTNQVHKMAVEQAETNAILRRTIGSQEGHNRRIQEIVDRLDQRQDKQAEILAVAARNAECVPDLYEKHRRNRDLINWAAGALAVLAGVMGLLGPRLNAWIFGAVK